MISELNIALLGTSARRPSYQLILASPSQTGAVGNRPNVHPEPNCWGSWDSIRKEPAGALAHLPLAAIRACPRAIPSAPAFSEQNDVVLV